jgi:GNAT superfamily N-acetyltransferase
MSRFLVRRALIRDAPRVETLLHEWLSWDPQSGRIDALRQAIRSNELLVAETGSYVVGFIHYVIHEDIIDGAPNAFITAFYVQARYRCKGLGTKLLLAAISDAADRGATFIETSTLHSRAKAFYERHGFRQTKGEIGEVFLELDVGRLLKTQ